MGLALVRAEHVPVERVCPGDRLILPGGQRVTVERVDAYEDGSLVVRWSRPARKEEPGAYRPDSTDPDNGRYLGSLQPLQRGDLVEVDRT